MSFKDIFQVLWPILVIVGGYILTTRKEADKNQLITENLKKDTEDLKKELDATLKEFKDFVTANQSVILNHTITLSLMTKTLDSLISKIDDLDKRTNGNSRDIAVLETLAKGH